VGNFRQFRNFNADAFFFAKLQKVKIFKISKSEKVENKIIAKSENFRISKSEKVGKNSELFLWKIEFSGATILPDPKSGHAKATPFGPIRASLKATRRFSFLGPGLGKSHRKTSKKSPISSENRKIEFSGATILPDPKSDLAKATPSGPIRACLKELR
jgi:hypothetical protein